MRRRLEEYGRKAACLGIAAAVFMAGCGSGGNSDKKDTAAEEKTTAEASAEDISSEADETEESTSLETEGVTQEDTEDGSGKAAEEETEIILFAAQSLNQVMEVMIEEYREDHPEVSIVGSYGSSGTLMTQIEEGAFCDVFFSAAQKQMDQLEEDGLVVEETRRNIVNNQVCVVTWKGSGTKVTGLETLGDAANMALADGSVPVGKYTRQALVSAGILEKADDVSAITSDEVSKALGGLEINECANVGVVASQVAEGSNEVGTVYYSDTYGLEDKLEILEVVPYELTGNVIYPAAQIVNKEADERRQQAAADFVEYLVSDEAKEIFKTYYFDTDVE